MTLLWTMALLAAGPTGPATSLLVFPVDAPADVPPHLKAALSERLVTTARQARAFAQVHSTQDLSTVMDMQRQRQLLDCDSSSCMAEIADALGADVLLRASLARVGTRYQLDARLVSAHSATVMGAAAAQTCSLEEDQLVPALAFLVAQLLDAGKLRHHLSATPQRCGPNGQLVSEPEQSTARAWWKPAALGTPPWVAAGGTVVVVIGLMAMTVGLYVVPAVAYVPTPVGKDPAQRRVFLDGLVVASAAGTVGIMVLGATLAALGAAGAGVGLFL